MTRKRDFFHTGLNVSRSDMEQMFNFMYGAYAGGKVYHVKKVADTNYNEWYDRMYVKYYDNTESIQTSIEAAIAAADDFDTILVHPGQWLPAATLAITQDSLKLLAVETGPNRALTRTEIRQYGNVDTDIISVEGAHNVEIAGFRLTPYNSTTAAGLVVGQTAETYGTYVHDNIFYGVQSGDPLTMPILIEFGVAGSFNADSTTIFNNIFRMGGTHGGAGGKPQIDWKRGHRSSIRGNSFYTLGNTLDSIAIKVDSTNSPQEGEILDNKFYAVEAGTILTISQTAATNHVFIDGNHFINQTAVANCLVHSDLCCGVNYFQGAIIGA